MNKTFYKRGFRDDFTPEEMEKVKQIDAFMRKICLFRGEDLLGEYRSPYIFLCCKTTCKYHGEEIFTFVNKYINVKAFDYDKIEYYLAKCIYRLIQNKHIEVFYAVNSFRPVYTVSGKCFPQRTSESVCFSNCIFTDIDLPKELQEKEDEELLEMMKSAYKELFDNVAPSIVIRSGGGFHIYYELSQTIDLTSDIMSELWKDTMRCLYRIFKDIGSDTRVIDMTRILRLPYSINRKEKYGPEGKTVTVTYENGIRYDLETLNHKLHFIAEGGTESLFEEVLDEMDSVYFAGAYDDETMFTPIDLPEEEDVFQDKPYMEPKKNNLTGCDKINEEPNEESCYIKKENNAFQDISLNGLKKENKKETGYKGISINYDSLPKDFFQNTDLLFWIYNRECHEGYRNYLLFIFGYNWYFKKYIQEFEQLKLKWEQLNEKFNPRLEKSELERSMKSCYYKYREMNAYKCIRNQTIQNAFEFTEEEKIIVVGNYYLTEEERRIKYNQRDRIRYHKRNANKEKKKTKAQEKRQSILNLFIDNPQLGYEEFYKLTGKSLASYYNYRRDARKLMT